MTDHTPLTEQQLADIDARASVATDGPWERYEKYGPDFFACTSGSYLRGVGTFNFGDGTDAEADEQFVKHAVQDVRALLDEVRRLKAQRKYLITQLAKKDAASGAGDRALAEFLGTPEPADAPAVADAPDPTPLRWGLNDVMWGDDDSVTVLLSGPDREPYWLELDAERAAVLRQDLASPDGQSA